MAIEDDKKPEAEAEDEFEIVEEAPKRDDKRLKDADDDEEEEGEGHAEDGADAPDDDPERERIREQRRQEKRDRRAAQKAARERDRQYINSLEAKLRELSTQVDGVQGHIAQQRANEIDQRIAYEARRYHEAEAAIRDATARGDSDLMVRAMRQRDDAIFKHRDLQGVKEKVSTAPAPQAQAPAMSPHAAGYARDFMSENAWYDPQGRDDDSAVMTALDNKIAAEGFDPGTEAYWAELRKRASKLLPHRFGAATGRRSPPVGSTREHVSAGTRKQVFISRERREALEASGDWEDPVRRNKMLKYYERYDRENSSR